MADAVSVQHFKVIKIQNGDKINLISDHKSADLYLILIPKPPPSRKSHQKTRQLKATSFDNTLAVDLCFITIVTFIYDNSVTLSTSIKKYQ